MMKEQGLDMTLRTAPAKRQQMDMDRLPLNTLQMALSASRYVFQKVWYNSQVPRKEKKFFFQSADKFPLVLNMIQTHGRL